MDPVTCNTNCCPTETVVNVPGAEGADGAAGANGSDGASAFTLLTAALTLTVIGDPHTLIVANNTAFAVGQPVFASDGTHFGTFIITSKTGTTSITGTWIGASGDSAPGQVIAIGGMVVPTGTEPTFSGLPTAFTDNSGGTPSDTIAAGVGIHTVTIPIELASLTTLAADLVTNYVPGYAFKILALSFAVTTLGTGAAASQVLNLEIGAINTTGGVLTVVLADTTPLGKVTNATAITAANIGAAGDTISVEVAAGGTVFTAGNGVLLIRLQNMDDADAFASLAAHVDALITTLT